MVDWSLLASAMIFLAMLILLMLAYVVTEVFFWVKRKLEEEPVRHIPPKPKHYPEDDWIERIMKD